MLVPEMQEGSKINTGEKNIWDDQLSFVKVRSKK
jgi:hypothetical protein